MSEEIERLRKEIDEIDREIVNLLARRAKAAQAIGRIKNDSNMPIYAPARERAVLDNIVAQNEGPLPASSLKSIFREIISACRALEQRPKIAYFGMPASFTHMAALKTFGSECVFVPHNDIRDIFSAVVKGSANYGVVPIESSTGGIVPETVDQFIDSPLLISGEAYLDVHHYLLSKGTLEEVKRVYSHAQPFAQCEQWLRENLPGAELITEASTSHAAQRAAAEGPGAAAISTELAAELYDLNIIAERIEDRAINRTRFWIIGQCENPPTGRDKTSLLFSTRHEAGALYRALETYARHNINLTMIQSRPSPNRPWEYVFFVDFQGHVSEPHVEQALRELERCSQFVRVLGAYPEMD